MDQVSELYIADILDWSERQTALLRRVADGERVNSAELDWANIIDEVESVGREQLHAVESLIVQALLHRLKAAGWPNSAAVAGWQAEARLFLRQARRRFAPSMRARIDLASLYEDARVGLPETIDGQVPLPVPAKCPMTLDELLME